MTNRIERPEGASECFNPECRSDSVFFVTRQREDEGVSQIACAACCARGPVALARRQAGSWTEKCDAARKEAVRLWNAVKRSEPIDPPLTCERCGVEFVPDDPDADPHDAASNVGWGWSEDGDYRCRRCVV